MPAFQIFRCRVVYPRQGSLLESLPARHELIRKVIEERPTAELRKGHTWHIGNLEKVGPNGLYFAFGRTAVSSIEQYHAADGNFVEVEFDTAPYTYVIVNLDLQVLSIAAKSRLAPTTPGISRQLQKLLNRSDVAGQYGVRFEIAEVKDPQDLIRHIRSAFAVRRFRLTFGRPNLFDANDDVQKPMERFLAAAAGMTGRTEVAGPNLNAEVLEDLVRSAASSGNDAIAYVVPDQSDRQIKKQLSGNPVIVQEEEPTTAEEKQSLLEKIRMRFRKVGRESSELGET